VENHRDKLSQAKSPTKPPSSRNLRGGLFLSSAILAKHIKADHQTGDCEQDIEKLNI